MHVPSVSRTLGKNCLLLGVEVFLQKGGKIQPGLQHGGRSPSFLGQSLSICPRSTYVWYLSAIKGLFDRHVWSEVNVIRTSRPSHSPLSNATAGAMPTSLSKRAGYCCGLFACVTVPDQDHRHERDVVERRGAGRVARCYPPRFGLPAHTAGREGLGEFCLQQYAFGDAEHIQSR